MMDDRRTWNDAVDGQYQQWRRNAQQNANDTRDGLQYRYTMLRLRGQAKPDKDARKDREREREYETVASGGYGRFGYSIGTRTIDYTLAAAAVTSE